MDSLFMDPQQPGTSSSTSLNINHSLNSLVDLSNLCSNGAKFFEDSGDKQRFVEEFQRLQLQNPHWSAIRLIRERLKLHMRMVDEQKMRKKEVDVKRKIANEPKRRSRPITSTEQDSDSEYEPPPSSSITDQLFENINEQIENDRLIDLDESRALFANADNMLVVDAGDGRCAILSCRDLLEKAELHRVEDVRLFNGDERTDEKMEEQKINERDFNGVESPSLSSTTKRPRFSIAEKPPRPSRIKHTCPKCASTFSYLHQYIDHIKEAHSFEDNEKNGEEDEYEELKPDLSTLNGSGKRRSRNSQRAQYL